MPLKTIAKHSHACLHRPLFWGDPHRGFNSPFPRRSSVLPQHGANERGRCPRKGRRQPRSLRAREPVRCGSRGSAPCALSRRRRWLTRSHRSSRSPRHRGAAGEGSRQGRRALGAGPGRSGGSLVPSSAAPLPGAAPAGRAGRVAPGRVPPVPPAPYLKRRRRRALLALAR